APAPDAVETAPPAAKTRGPGAAGISYTQPLVCPANARTRPGRRVAGKELSDGRIGGWIRPVSALSTGELSLDEIRVQDGSPPRLLNIITISLKAYQPHFYQTENHLVADGPWLRSGNLPAARLPALIDDVDRLWINGCHGPNGLNDRIPESLANEHLSSSLLFIRPENLRIRVVEGPRPRGRVWAGFEYKNETYRLAVTDPVVENRYLKKEKGAHPVEKRDVYLTVAIDDPREGFCRKLVAAII
ncbi:MAG: hypothetical protein GY859_23610, partial [Desulfobacterales bacterium]|nr:hypothetical protein [Desulfobacterales bacterium]